MIKEEWKQIDGFEYYYISNLGRVKSTRRWSGTQFYERKKIISLHKHKTKGYIYVSISRDGKNYNLRVHRLVAKAFIPNPNNKPQVNHIDGNKENNNINNLEWVTNQENQIHAWRKGLCKKHTTKRR